MKILAYTIARNEADILPWSVAHLQQQGVGVYVLDNWSDDGSYEMLPGLGLEGFERWPVEPQEIFEWGAALTCVEELAAKSGADWCYLNDADEFRRSCWPGVTLAEGIRRVDAERYTAINHRVYVFQPVDDGYKGDPEGYLRYYTPRDPLCVPPQQKAFKNTGAVKIRGGGHRLLFPGMRVYPEKFVLKHYPFRTQAQAAKKIRERLTRRSPAERASGWHVHYDLHRPEDNFIRDPATLKYWRDPQSPFPA